VLVLTRKPHQSVRIGDEIQIHVVAIGDGKVRIGIDAPRSIPIVREEIYFQNGRDRSHQDDRDE